METSLKVKEYENLVSIYQFVEDIITKNYLTDLENYEVQRLPQELEKISIENYSRVYKFERIVTDKNESMLDKLVTVLATTQMLQASIVMFIRGKGDKVEYYLCLVDKSFKNNDIKIKSETFKNSLNGNFPGIVSKNIDISDIKETVEEVTQKRFISAISGISSIRNEEKHEMEKYVQGLEYLVDSLRGKYYDLMVIADAVSNEELLEIKNGYEELYTNLSMHQSVTYSLNETEGLTASIGVTVSSGTTESIGESIAKTQSASTSNGWTVSKGTSESSGSSKESLTTRIFGKKLTGNKQVTRSTTNSNSTTQSKNITASESVAKTKTQQATSSKTKSSNNSESSSITKGKTLQYVSENKTVKDALKRLDAQIERLEKCESYGAFNYATYVFTDDAETNMIAANTYSALMRGDNSFLQASYINNWRKGDSAFEDVRKYLKVLSHPVFLREGVAITPATISNSYEVAVSLGFPKKSISGLAVVESIAFGRSISKLEEKEVDKKVNLGKIYHMGDEESLNVELDLKSLAMHTFVTGSTGSGKSNTVYQLLRELNKKDVKFMVVEPAKGEYKHIFGKTAKVYGTNPKYTEQLKINPFKFTKEIHVLEHIDRLVEIFNVCWPMYSAMPAVLKESIERAYKGVGWNFSTSGNEYNLDIYPTFDDVLNELNKVIEDSKYSEEVKSNYVGALETRLRSLTNGIYGQIFSGNELGDEQLFDENVIVDLSRIGSIETKSLIMGILVMRLQEYRMSSGRMNSDLKHITVLEEAHNILKRTSTEQSSEGSNVLGKAVEMLSNAIAEVRTYGEGFIIVDQAPGLLDMSVIRNTNTKIIMRLPDESDRNLVGKAANLSDDQISELSKLPTGVAAVYQNNWIEPVLTKVNYDNKEESYHYTPKKVEIYDSKSEIIKLLMEKRKTGELGVKKDIFEKLINESSFSSHNKLNIFEYINMNEGEEKIYDLIIDKKIEERIKKAKSIKELKDIIVGELELEKSIQYEWGRYILEELIKRFNYQKNYKEKWDEAVEKGEI